jgi:hypothetical protein
MGEFAVGFHCIRRQIPIVVFSLCSIMLTHGGPYASRQIEVNRMTTGIYAIVHTASGLRYIGQSISVYRRWQWHQIELRNRSHHCPKLSKLWQSDPRTASFELILLTECRPNDLDRLEQEEIDKAVAKGICLNAVTSPLVKQIMDERGRQKKEAALRAKELVQEDYDEVLERMGEEQEAQEAEARHNDAFDSDNMTAEDVFRLRGW